MMRYHARPSRFFLLAAMLGCIVAARDVPSSGQALQNLSVAAASRSGPRLGQLLAAEDGEDAECTLTKGLDYYDLTPLKSDQIEFPITADDKDGDSSPDLVNLAVCRPLDGKVGDDEDGVIYKGRSLGKFSSRLKYHDRETLSLTYDRGSSCGSDRGRLSTLIIFKCFVESSANPLVPITRPRVDRPIVISQDSSDHCQVVLQWTTAAACPRFRPDGNAGLTVKGAISVFISIVLLAVLVWFIGTIFYKRAVLKERGWSQFPSAPSAIVSSMGNIIILGLSNLYLFVKNLTSRERGLSLGGNERSRSGYSSLAFFDADADED